MLNEIFDAIYCINLEHREDRWKKFQSFWKPLGIEVERLLAVDGSKVSFKPGTFKDDHSRNKFAIGCSLSHVQALERSVYCEHTQILILEDDAQPCENFLEHFKKSYEQLPEDFKFCYIGGNHTESPAKVSENIGKTSCTKSTASYIVKDTSFMSLLAMNIKYNLRRFALDEIYEGMQKKNPFYTFMPRLVHQYESYSDIQRKNVYYGCLRDLE